MGARQLSFSHPIRGGVIRSKIAKLPRRRLVGLTNYQGICPVPWHIHSYVPDWRVLTGELQCKTPPCFDMVFVDAA